MNIECSIPIQGWMDAHDLEWLARHVENAHHIVEVGCWQGRSTICLAENSPTDAMILAVDTWLGSEEHQDQFVGNDPDWVLREFVKNTQLWRDKIRMLRMTSTSAAERAMDVGATFDFVFIDAAHDYDNIRADILAWKPLVAPGGLLCGHDAGHPPIARALKELLPNRLPDEYSIWQVRL